METLTFDDVCDDDDDDDEKEKQLVDGDGHAKHWHEILFE